jgi:hypothetical protein
MRKKEFRHITIWEEDQYPDILFNVYSTKLDIDIDIARELIANRFEFVGERKIYALVDFTNVKSVTKEARDYMNSPEGGLNGILGGAFLSNNVVATLFINLYLKISNPTVPAKFFTSKVEALKWLTKIKEEHKSLEAIML